MAKMLYESVQEMMSFQLSDPEDLNLEGSSKPKLEENGFRSTTVALDPYEDWLKNHPSALDSFEEMMKEGKGKCLVVFLDYDGTLSPIVNDPEMAFMSDKMRSAVAEVADIFPTAIVTGRSRDKVKRFVKLQNVTYAGSHGMDISPTVGIGSFKRNGQKQFGVVDHEGEDGIYFQPAKDFFPAIQELRKVLEEEIKTIEGSSVEDNKFCVSVHYRCVDAEEVDTLIERVKSIMEGFPNFRISEGKKVMEIRPKIDWDKGHALLFLIKRLGFDNSDDFLPVYIGDDRTDEDAFKAIVEDIGQGFPIVVSSTPKETKASYSLRDTNEVMSFLMRIAEWKKGSSAPNDLDA